MSAQATVSEYIASTVVYTFWDGVTARDFQQNKYQYDAKETVVELLRCCWLRLWIAPRNLCSLVLSALAILSAASHDSVEDLDLEKDIDITRMIEAGWVYNTRERLRCTRVVRCYSIRPIC